MPAFALLIAIGLTMFLVLSSFVVSLVLRFIEIELTTVQAGASPSRGANSRGRHDLR